MPPPSDPLRVQVLEAVQTKLRGINGNPTYFNTVKSTSVVLDPGVGPNMLLVPATELPYFIVEVTPSGSKFYMPSMRMKEDFQIAVIARNDVATNLGTNLTRRMETWEQLIADIEVALTRDISLGGLAVDVRLQTPTPAFDMSASPSVVVVQPVVIRLIREYGKPWHS